jgi:hypothetical protein
MCKRYTGVNAVRKVGERARKVGENPRILMQFSTF